MAGRWMELGRYNAQGMGGGDALGYGIERMVTGLQSSPHSERGIAARLRYLTAPVDQTRVEGRHQRDLATRRLSVRPRVWDAAVDAWLADDAEALDRIWDDLITDLGSDYDAYSNVSSVGWAA
ncbi:hypothetical protein [Streptomyces rimosus]|uniref:hypothetical protein n=1 Tax=Streptomyces rimosus TaxID=1927 RepID=UPI0005184EBF|nr:hypothetical protein [Streptomyces rimosus]